MKVLNRGGSGVGGTRSPPPLKWNIYAFDGNLVFYPALHFNFVRINLYFLISLFLISFLNYNWKMTFNRVFKPYMHLFSYVKIFTSFFHHCIEQNICFYSFTSSDWEIYKIATPVLHQCWTNYVCERVPPAACNFTKNGLLHWHVIRLILCKTDILKNIWKQSFKVAL